MAYYRYEENSRQKKIINNFIENNFIDVNKIYFANGSLGDHSLNATLLPNIKDKNLYGLIVPENYLDFYKSFDIKEIRLVGIDHKSVNFFDNYFINNNDFIYNSNSNFKPLLPVYYPIISKLMDELCVLRVQDFTCFLLGIQKNSISYRQTNLNQLKIAIKNFIATEFNIHGNFVIIAPEQNTLLGLGDDYWIELVAKLKNDINLPIIINSSSNFYDKIINKNNIYNYLFPPHLIFAALSCSFISVLAPSGLSHFSQIFSDEGNIFVVSDWRNGDQVEQKFVKNEYVRSSTQENIFDFVNINNINFIRYNSNDSNNSVYDKLLNLITAKI